MTVAPSIQPQSHIWQWQGFPIRYQCAGTEGPALVLVHGFGASSDHWRKNLPVLANQCRVYAIDLIGFGQSAKPAPGQPIAYTFETWGQQILDFCQEVVQDTAFLIANSIGCIAAMQTAVMAPAQIRGVMALDCSLRMLHDRKRITLPWYRRYSAPIFQKVLTFRPIGHFFFARLARKNVIRNILTQAYGRADAVTDELVDLLIQPAHDEGAADVFLAFTAYSQGPLAEDLLPQMDCPVLLVWGEADPWESVELGKELAKFDTVEDFVTLPGVGHCPQDEAPELVNSLIQNWVTQHYHEHQS